MSNFLYVDNSNVWIEGCRVAAVEHGMAPDIWTAQEERILDPTWKIDFGQLYEVARGDPAGRAYLFGSRPPPNDSLWAAAEHQGFQPVIFDRNARNREKKVDTGIVTAIMRDSFELIRAGDEATFTLVAGDRDYVPMAEDLARRGIPLIVMFWDHASEELKDAARFESLNPHLARLALRPR